MFALKLVFLLVSCIALINATPVDKVDFFEGEDAYFAGSDAVLSRQARSPQGGSVDLGYRKDQYGREASVQYNHNIYTSKDGRGSIDAYGQASRNFDYNRNNYGGGIQGRWRF